MEFGPALSLQFRHEDLEAYFGLATFIYNE